MKKYLLLLFFISVSQLGIGQSKFKQFFKPLPDPTAALTGTPGAPSVKVGWQPRPIVALPAFKVNESIRENTKVDVNLLTSTGGGFSLQKLSLEKGEYYCDFSWSPITLLLSGNLSAEDNPIDLSVASTVGIFNNLLMIGGGYDLGQVQTEVGGSVSYLLESILIINRQIN